MERAMELYKKHDVHGRSPTRSGPIIILGGHRHIPTQTRQRGRPHAAPLPSTPPPRRSTWRALWAATTLSTTAVLRDRVEKESSLSHYNSMNVLSMHALIGAYRPRRLRVGGRAVPGADGQCGLRLRLYRPATLRAWRSPGPRAPTCCFWTAPAGAEAHGKSIEAAAARRLGRGRGLAGRPSLPRPVPHPHESGIAALPGAGGLPPPGRIRVQRLTAALRRMPAGRDKGPLPRGSKKQFLKGSRSGCPL